MNNRENMYNIETYTDAELLDVLDLNNPTDRELEAKIVSLIRKYENMQNQSVKQHHFKVNERLRFFLCLRANPH